MKQHIMTEQIKELSGKGKRKYINTFWQTYKGKPIDSVQDGQTGRIYTKKDLPIEWYPVLSIGEMIEFLAEEKEEFSIYYAYSNGYDFQTDCNSSGEWDYIKNSKELCDVLWEAVKEVLEK